MAGQKLTRHWFIVCRPLESQILYLLSAFSIGHIRRSDVLDGKPYFISPAKRHHIALVFSGLPTFYDYRLHYGKEGVEKLVPNEFKMLGDDIVTVVKVIG